MKIADSVALVTGADHGPGRHFAAQLVQRGAATVYATARPGTGIDVPGVHVLTLDDAEPTAVAAVAETIGEVTLLVNASDLPTSAGPAADGLDVARRQLDADYLSLLQLISTFMPTLQAGGRGAIVNVLSTPSPPLAAVGRISPADHAASNCALITAVLFGPTRTDMITEVDLGRNDLAAVVRAVLAGIEVGDAEIIPDILAASARNGQADSSIQTYRPLL